MMYIGDSIGLMVYCSAVLFILGTVFGSFIHCTAMRIVSGEDWMRGRSHCDVCGHVLSLADLIPLVSYTVQKGRCRYCGAKLSPRHPAVEFLAGCLFLGLFVWRRRLDMILLRDLILVVILLGLSLVDLETYTIPDGFILAGLINWAAGGLFSGNIRSYFLNGLSGGLLIAGGLLTVSLVMDKVLKKESLGGGDVKLVFMVCLYLGVLKGLLMLFVSCLSGLVFVVLLKKNRIPFGPSISIAAYIVLLAGEMILDWYMRLL